MAKIARRSVASNPSSLTSSTSVSNSNLISSNIISTSDHKSSESTTPDPLRSSGYQLTTRTISSNNTNNNYKRHEITSSADHSANSASNNNSRTFDNINTNTKNATKIISQNFNNTEDLLAAAAEREKVRMEFYATYDVMTGVRIAATLGGFFGLMVFLIVYKSRSHSNETLKVLKDPKIAAVAAACMLEEEDRKIQEAMDATGLSIFPDEYDTMLYRRQRMLSIGNVSAPPILHRGFRFSSVGGGGYSSLLEPPRRYSYSGGRRKSASESSRILSAYPMGSSFGTDDYFIETDDELETEFDHLSTRDDATQQHAYLEVPIAGQESRRSSAMTCCSTESSYLERRCSALTLGLTSLPSTFEETSKNRRTSTDIWDYYYPDIQVISATPKSSPCPSERSLYDKHKGSAAISSTADNTTTLSSEFDNNAHYNPTEHLKNGTNDIKSTRDKQLPLVSSTDNSKSNQKFTKNYGDNNELKLVVKRKISDPSSVNNNSYSNVCNSYRYNIQYHSNDTRRAPLASISSFKISSIDYQDSDLKSLGSDSVFVESYADTDDDMDQFSTDSDELSIGGDQVEKDITKPPPEGQCKIIDEIISTKSEFSHPGRDDVHQKLNIKRKRPILQRHQTISSVSSSNDRIMLISQQSQEQPFVEEDLHSLRDPELNRVSKYPDFVSSPPFLSHREISSLPTDEATTLTGTTSSTQNTEIQKAKIRFSYDNNNDSCSSNSKRSSSKDNKNEKSKMNNSSGNNSNNECAEVNVIIENRPTNTISSSVILELPVIALPSQDDDPPRDPSLPGTSRKWSKETLF